jgi:hypothetical protein
MFSEINHNYTVTIEKSQKYAMTQQCDAAECKPGDEYDPSILWMIVIRKRENDYKIVHVPARDISYADAVRFQSAIEYAFKAGIQECFEVVRLSMQFCCKSIPHEEM